VSVLYDAWSWFRKRPSLWAVYAAFAVVAARINPFRFVYNDDDFAYARMVEHLLATGRYRTDAWSAATLPFQTAWGALFSLPFGYSPGALRMSTIVVFVFALAALYQLLRDHDTPDVEAGLLTLVFMASPMIFQLAFSFMTDLQYLSWMLIAVFFYARALRSGAYAPMAMGALAGAAAMGTRQVGIALVGALAAMWLFDPERRKRVLLYLVGLSLPLVAAYMQFRLGRDAPTFTQKLRLVQQTAYLHDAPTLRTEVAWRPTVILQYVGWYLFPLLPLFLTHYAEGIGRLAEPRRIARPVRPWLFWVAVALFGYGAFVAVGEDGRLMPSLEWLLNRIGECQSDFFRHRLSLATAVFGVLALWLILRQYVPLRGRPGVSSTDKLLGLVTLGMLATNVAFFTLVDRYTIVYVPLVLWVIGRTAGRWGGATRLIVLVGGLCSLWWSTSWTYGRLEPLTAHFALAERALERGATSREVGEGWQWQCYHGVYDEWVESVRQREAPSIDEFFPWFYARGANARYILTEDDPGADALILDREPWRDLNGATHTSYLVDTRPEVGHP
jgi:hypothetical protein